MKSYLLLSLLFAGSAFAEPTELRDWNSTAGTTIKAQAMEVMGDEVLLKTEDGRELKVPIAKFVEENQVFLREHFAEKLPEPGKPQGSGAPMVDDGLEFPTGQATGPVDTGEGSNYYVYVPASLRKDRPAPLMFYTGAGGGKMDAVEKMGLAAELNGWIIAASVESKNGSGHPEGNHEHVRHCLEHLFKVLPIDEKRVYFTGSSGGGAMSFYNALRLDSMGNMPVNGYSPDKKFPKKQYCYGLGGAMDYNRYLTAQAVSEYDDRGFHRFYVGGHIKEPKEAATDGITWLNGRYLGDQRKETELDAERLDYEAFVIDWIDELSENEPYRAYYWCNFLIKEYGIEGYNEKVVRVMADNLAEEPNNLRYSQGMEALNEFSQTYFAPEGKSGGSKMGHTTETIQEAAEELAAKYAGVPEIEAVARQLAKPTIGGNK